jgi:hypothetical protein
LVINFRLNQIQMFKNSNKKKSVVDKDNMIATSKRVRRTANHRIWFVQSENPKASNVFYRVMFNDDLDCFVCDCLASRI